MIEAPNWDLDDIEDTPDEPRGVGQQAVAEGHRAKKAARAKKAGSKETPRKTTTKKKKKSVKPTSASGEAALSQRKKSAARPGGHAEMTPPSDEAKVPAGRKPGASRRPTVDTQRKRRWQKTSAKAGPSARKSRPRQRGCERCRSCPSMLRRRAWASDLNRVRNGRLPRRRPRSARKAGREASLPLPNEGSTRKPVFLACRVRLAWAPRKTTQPQRFPPKWCSRPSRDDRPGVRRGKQPGRERRRSGLSESRRPNEAKTVLIDTSDFEDVLTGVLLSRSWTTAMRTFPTRALGRKIRPRLITILSPRKPKPSRAKRSAGRWPKSQRRAKHPPKRKGGRRRSVGATTLIPSPLTAPPVLQAPDELW